MVLPFATCEGTARQFDPQSALRLASSSCLDSLEPASSATNLLFHSIDLCQNYDGQGEAVTELQNPTEIPYFF